MTIEYFLKVEDYLQWYLYDASLNKKLQYKSKRNWIFVTGFFILTTCFFYLIKDNAAIIISLLIAFISLIFYPIYQKKEYKKYYYEHANNIFKKNENTVNYLTIYTNNIIIKDIFSETKINNNALIEIVEINMYYFLKIQPGGAIIIPKKQIKSFEELGNKLVEYCNTNHIVFSKSFDWKW